MADLSRLERIPTRNTKNTGKSGGKTQGETLKNKSNHTSTRQSNTQDHKVYEQQRERYKVEFIPNPMKEMRA